MGQDAISALRWTPGGPLLAHRAACDGLTQPFEQAFKTRQALADLRLALLHGSDAEKPAGLDGHQHAVRDFPRPEAEIEEQRRQAAQYEDRDATTDRVREPAVMSITSRPDLKVALRASLPVALAGAAAAGRAVRGLKKQMKRLATQDEDLWR